MLRKPLRRQTIGGIATNVVATIAPAVVNVS
jgi:hypothetical protein